MVALMSKKQSLKWEREERLGSERASSVEGRIKVRDRLMKGRTQSDDERGELSDGEQKSLWKGEPAAMKGNRGGDKMLGSQCNLHIPLLYNEAQQAA